MKLLRGLWLLLWCVVLWACKSEEPATPVTPVSPESTIDKYAELVSACQVWCNGGGSTATGGNGSTSIYHVTSLEDKAPYNPVDGTLRFAVTRSGARVVVFDIAGTIHLTAPLTIDKSDLTILGQSAPGQGICIADYPLVLDQVNNVIIRFIRVRLGNKSLEKDNETDYDAISVNNCKNVIIDHCSASWSVDECVSCYGNENFTLEYSFITESLRDAGHVKGPHGYGGIWGGKNATFHHNLLAHHDSRNPRFDHDFVEKKRVTPVDFINNVVYNWGDNAAYGGEGTKSSGNQRQYNFINNYYKPGPSTPSASNRNTRLLNPTMVCDNCGGTIVPGKFYLVGNVMSSSENVTKDNWLGAHPDKGVSRDDMIASCKSEARFTFNNAYTSEQSAQAAYETVLAKAGCSYSRDALDERIVNDVKNGTGKLIDKPEDAGGWPELNGDETIEDTDGDHIPDAWETKYGLDPNDRADGAKKTLVTGFTNYEVYLNDKVKNLY